MALFPYHSTLNVFEDPFLDHGFEPIFGVGLLPHDFLTDYIVPRSGVHHLPTGYRRPWALARKAMQDITKDQRNFHFGKDGFQACVDVHHFLPSEVSVKTVNQTVIVEGKHEERDDIHGSIERNFVRKYQLPKEYDVSTIQSSLSSDGVLSIKAPSPQAAIAGERHIPITHTSIPIHLTLKANEPHDDAMDSKP